MSKSSVPLVAVTFSLTTDRSLKQGTIKVIKQNTLKLAMLNVIFVHIQLLFQQIQQNPTGK